MSALFDMDPRFCSQCGAQLSDTYETAIEQGFDVRTGEKLPIRRQYWRVCTSEWAYGGGHDRWMTDHPEGQWNNRREAVDVFHAAG